jgi:quercetin dioxygenase-like cupin family protein
MRRLLFVTPVLLCLAVSTARAQDPTKADPKHYKVEFENAEVRVLHVSVGPHEKTNMHSHPASVVVWLSDGRVKFTYPDGKTEEANAKAGKAEWSAPVTHSGENLSDKPLEVIQIELKSKPAAAKPAGAKKKD